MDPGGGHFGKDQPFPGQGGVGDRTTDALIQGQAGGEQYSHHPDGNQNGDPVGIAQRIGPPDAIRWIHERHTAESLW